MQMTLSGFILIPFFLLTVVYIMRKTRNKSFTIYQKITIYSFAFYCYAVLYLTFFPFQIQTGMYANQTPWLSRINFDPVLDLSALPNLLMLVPLSVYYYLLKKKSTFFRAVLLGFSISFGIEFVQFLTNYFLGGWRGADIADIVVNTMGAALGYLLVKIVFTNETSSFFQKFKLYS
ncbi:VanZ like family protein [Carnobacterium viridans]|uniref:VanZ like family protein n=2 Tax=Carnobacterium viridans TaxID=174587 RepID=A0A1H0YMG9_9LACT|nr:VanZ like family protein [Carnobacterium viridans]